MMNDYDPKTGVFWRALQGDIPNIFYQEGKLVEQNLELYNLVYDSLPSHLTSAVNEPITMGLDRTIFQVKVGDGVSLCFALMTIFNGNPRPNEHMTDHEVVAGAHVALHTGNPRTCLVETIRPALKRMTDAQESVKGSQTFL